MQGKGEEGEARVIAREPRSGCMVLRGPTPPTPASSLSHFFHRQEQPAKERGHAPAFAIIVFNSPPNVAFCSAGKKKGDERAMTNNESNMTEKERRNAHSRGAEVKKVITPTCPSVRHARKERST